MLSTALTTTLGIEVPLIGGAMYPCSNPELVAAVSAAGGIGIVQPLSLTYVHGYDYREGLRYIRSLTQQPFGVNLIIEQSSKKYLERVHEWLDIALEEGVGFFITALGDPKWVVRQANSSGATIYHDVTERRFADKAHAAGVDGLICVNNRAGGHAGGLAPQVLLADMGDLGLPLICAGGIGTPAAYREVLAMGYAGVQLGTRLIASVECTAHADYKQAIIDAGEQDIVLTERLTGVPVAIIKTPYIEKTGTKAGPFARWMLRGPRTKHWVRLFYSLRSIWMLKKAAQRGPEYRDYFQAGKSVAGIHNIPTVADIVESFKNGT